MIRKFQLGGQQEQALMQFIQGLALTLQADPQLVVQIALLNPEALLSAILVFQKTQDMNQAAQAFQQALQQKVNAAKHGIKLQYLKSLKHQCAEDEELVYYKKGGSVECGCKKKGGKVLEAKCGAVAKFKEVRKGLKGPKDTLKFKDLAARDSFYINTYGSEDLESTRPGSYKKDSKGKITWVPDRTKPPYKKENKREEPIEPKSKQKPNITKPIKKDITKSMSMKCGSKMKKHQLGGSLNGIPFMQKGTPEGGMKTRYDNFSWWDFVPFVGSYRDIMRAYDYPSTGNIINAGLSTAGDALGLGAIGAVAKATSKYNKIAKALKASGFFRPTGVGRLWIKVGTKQTPINAGKFGTIGTKTEPAVFTKTVPEVDLTEPVMWGFSAVPARTIKNSLYEPNQ